MPDSPAETAWYDQAEAKLVAAMQASLDRRDYQALKEDATIALAVFGRRRNKQNS